MVPLGDVDRASLGVHVQDENEGLQTSYVQDENEAMQTSYDQLEDLLAAPT